MNVQKDRQNDRQKEWDLFRGRLLSWDPCRYVLTKVVVKRIAQKVKNAAAVCFNPTIQ
jgi:hypothetical protein